MRISDWSSDVCSSDLVAKVVTLGSPFSGDPRHNNVWRLYELVAGHRVDEPPLKVALGVKPPVPTLAIWSRRDGIVATTRRRGTEGERPREVDTDGGHQGVGGDGGAHQTNTDAETPYINP